MIHHLDCGNIKAVISENGAELISLKKNNSEIIWQGSENYWPGKAPILFPICGFLKEDSYTLYNRSYNLGVHGFAKDQKFSVIRKSEDTIVLELKENNETLSLFPFRFTLKITFSLSIDGLSIQFEVTNKEKEDIYYSIGWHPGFNITYPAKIRLNSNSSIIRKAVARNGLIGENSQFKDSEIVLTPETFQDGGIVLENLNPYGIELISPNYKLQLISPDFPINVLWGQLGANFICIEPWHGMGDYITHDGNFLNKDYLVTSPTGETQSFSISLNIQ